MSAAIIIAIASIVAVAYLAQKVVDVENELERMKRENINMAKYLVQWDERLNRRMEALSDVIDELKGGNRD